MKPLWSRLWRALTWPLRALEWLGRVVLGIVAVGALTAVVLWAHIQPAPLVLPSRFVLEVTLEAPLTEEPPPAPLAALAERPAALAFGPLVETLDRAAQDPRVAAVLFDLNDFAGASYAQLEELRAAVARLRAAGKPVWAHADQYEQKAYFLASAATHVALDPDGYVLLPGLALEPTYFKAALDALGLTVHAFRAGRYKSFVEPFTRTDMSDDEREAASDLIAGLWRRVRDAIAHARGRDAAAIEHYHREFDTLLAAHRGDAARLAQEEKLVDALAPFDEWRRERYARLELNADEHAVSWQDYRRHEEERQRARWHSGDGEVLVLAVAGAIVEDAEPGEPLASAAALVQALEDAAEDERVRAVVLRVDSPGGSAHAAEQVRRAVAKVQQAGKPVVASFSGLAASGGYWLSASADAIVVSPTTVTGSIGVFALVPDAAGLMQKLRLSTDGVRTGPFAAPLDPRQPLPAPVARALQASVNHTYERFVRVVAQGRSLPEQEVEAIAQGRVWLGDTAVKLGLADALGGVHEAIELARARANAPHARVRWFAPTLTPQQLLRQMFFAETRTASQANAWLSALIPAALPPATWHAVLQAPREPWALCLCLPPD